MLLLFGCRYDLLISLDKELVAPFELAGLVGRKEDSELAIQYVFLLILAKELIHLCTELAIQNTESSPRCCEENTLQDDRVALKLANHFVHEIGTDSIEGPFMEGCPVVG